MDSKVTIYGPDITYQYDPKGEFDTTTGGGCSIEIPAKGISTPESIRNTWQASFKVRWGRYRDPEIVFARLQELMKDLFSKLPDNLFTQREAYLAGVTDDPGEYVIGWVTLAKRLAMEDAEELAHELQRKQDREDSVKGISCKIIKTVKGSGGEEGVDPSALVEIVVNGSSPLRFNCRNIFDFGYVINPDYPVMPGMEKGGLYNQGKWQTFEVDKGWFDVREATPEEKRALNYLYQNPPICDGIRM